MMTDSTWVVPLSCCRLVVFQALYRAHALSEGGQRHVTIADLSQGVVHPSKVGNVVIVVVVIVVDAYHHGTFIYCFGLL